MVKRFKRRKEIVVEFCDRCGSVCDSDCRRNGILERARERALLRGLRFSWVQHCSPSPVARRLPHLC